MMMIKALSTSQCYKQAFMLLFHQPPRARCLLEVSSHDAGALVMTRPYVNLESNLTQEMNMDVGLCQLSQRAFCGPVNTTLMQGMICAAIGAVPCFYRYNLVLI